MKKIKRYGKIVLALVLVSIMTGGYSYAKPRKGNKSYVVTITNVTANNVITPPLVIIHESSFELFKLGEPSSDELAALAEDGDSSSLQTLLETRSDVLNFMSATEALLPGDSITFNIESQDQFKYISVAGMLASSNDAFFAINNYVLPAHGSLQLKPLVYDAGSEKNSELCEFIPGPPCGNGGVRDTEDSEGFVYIHNGIHGIGDLDPATLDWRGPVAIITIEPAS